MKWNLRMVAAHRDIWRPTDLLAAFKDVGFSPSLSKVAALWGSTPVTIRLDDLDKICTALNCTVSDLLEAEAVAAVPVTDQMPQAVGDRENRSGPTRPTPRRDGPRRLLPPN